MAGTAVETTDVTTALATLLEGVENLRVYDIVADNIRPPAAVIGQPTIDFTDQSGGFCRAVWLFGLTVITTRSNDRTAQKEMSRLLLDIVTALRGVLPDSLFSVEPLDARPVAGVAVNGQELPAYVLNIRVRA